MNLIELDTILRLRRDNDYNYQKIANTFIPAKGEVCLVDTSTNGLRAKVGDGVSIFANLQYIDKDIASNVIIRGYIYDNQFYSDANFTTLVEASVNKIYIDAVRSVVYIYDGTNYVPITQTISAATAATAGIMKLYNTTGQNTDGTMSQKAITDELNDKVEIAINAENESLTFMVN